jgi:hypothetical protein
VRISEERSTDVTAGPGGVMTDEVGVVTGDLTVRTEAAEDGSVRALVAYQGALDWYMVTDGPTTLGADDLDTVHAQVVTRVTRGDRGGVG